MNKWHKNSYPLTQLSIGVELSLETFTFDSGVAGPHIHVQASVHGAEIQGNALIMHLMETLPASLLSGSITFIPFANPYATLQKSGTYTLGRNNPITGHNWNRNFVDILKVTQFDLKQYCKKIMAEGDISWSEIKNNFKTKLLDLYEQYLIELEKAKQLHTNNYLNLLLQKISAKADYVLDLHTGPVATEYIYTPNYSLERAKLFNISFILETQDYFAGAMDEAFCVPWFELAKEFNLQGRKIELDNAAYTIELGSEENFSMQAAIKSAEGIYNFLANLKMVNPKKSEQNAKFVSCRVEDFKTLYSPIGGLYDYLVLPGQFFRKGDVLAICYQRPILHEDKIQVENYSSKILAPTDGIMINRCPSSNVHQGMELFQYMSNYK